MSVLTVGKELSRLTYSEMQILVKELNIRLEIGLPNEQIATALAEVGDSLSVDVNTGEEKEIAHLRQVFKRMRSISVQVVNSHFVVKVGALQCSSPSLNTALLQMTDQLVATQAMGLKP
jgi:hypothetical protein